MLRAYVYAYAYALVKTSLTRQRFARVIIDAETLRSLFVNISRFFGISRRTLCISFHQCILMSGTCSRDLKLL